MLPPFWATPHAMSGPIPSPDLLERHRAAMEIIHDIDPDERVALLAAVVAPTSPQLLRLAEEREASAGEYALVV